MSQHMRTCEVTANDRISDEMENMIVQYMHVTNEYMKVNAEFMKETNKRLAMIDAAIETLKIRLGKVN